MLVNCGFSDYEARVYSVLLPKKTLTPTEISVLSGVPRGKIYEVLDKLSTAGYCIQVDGARKKYRANNPRDSFETLIEELENKKQFIFQSSGELTRIYESEGTKDDPMDYIEVVRDKKTITQKLQKLEERSQKEALFFAKPPYAMNYKDPSNWEAQIESTKRGVKFKCVFMMEPGNEKNFFEMVAYFQSIGEEVKIIDYLPMKLVIFDQKAIIFTLKNKYESSHNLTALFIEHEDLAKTLVTTFNYYWEQSFSPEEYQKRINDLNFQMPEISNTL